MYNSLLLRTYITVRVEHLINFNSPNIIYVVGLFDKMAPTLRKVQPQPIRQTRTLRAKQVLNGMRCELGEEAKMELKRSPQRHPFWKFWNIRWNKLKLLLKKFCQKSLEGQIQIELLLMAESNVSLQFQWFRIIPNSIEDLFFSFCGYNSKTAESGYFCQLNRIKVKWL